MRKFAAPLLITIAVVAFIPAAKAFFSELEEMKQELVTWQTTHAADFSDLLNTLEDLSGSDYEDVTDADWFSPYVVSVSDWGIVTGYKDEIGKPLGKFGPSNPVTVAELLKMAMEAAQVKEEECGLVPPIHTEVIGHWAAKYVSCGEASGIRILKAQPLNLNRIANRAEVLSVIHDAFRDQVPPIFSNFKDTANHPLEADIAFAYSRGIVSGDKDGQGIELGTFRPNEPINRAEVAKIIYERLKVDVKDELAAGL